MASSAHLLGSMENIVKGEANNKICCPGEAESPVIKLLRGIRSRIRVARKNLVRYLRGKKGIPKRQENEAAHGEGPLLYGLVNGYDQDSCGRRMGVCEIDSDERQIVNFLVESYIVLNCPGDFFDRILDSSND